MYCSDEMLRICYDTLSPEDKQPEKYNKWVPQDSMIDTIIDIDGIEKRLYTVYHDSQNWLVG